MKTFELLDKFPTVAEILETPRLKRLVQRVNQNTVVTTVRSVLDDVRQEYQQASSQPEAPSLTELAERIARRVLLGEDAHARPVINATGNVLHPLLGPPPLSESALDSLVVLGRDYASLDMHPQSGKAELRNQDVHALLVELTGAEAALAVNSFAGALLLTTGALASGKEILIARQHVLETSSGHRVADLLTAGGGILKEVGAANRTQLSDYSSALTPQTGAIVTVAGIPSGPELAFENDASCKELLGLAERQGIPLVQVLDCATLLETDKLGLPPLPSLPASAKQGVSLTIARGEGLVGGPECGLILGQRSYVELLQKHVWASSLQLNKLTSAALAATLQAYRDPAQALLQIPVLSLLTTAEENLRLRAERIAPQLAAIEGIDAAAAVETNLTASGERLSPLALPSWSVLLELGTGKSTVLVKALRLGQPSVLATEHNDKVYLDLRSVLPRQDLDLVSAVAAAMTVRNPK